MASEIEGETWYFAGSGSFSPFSVIDVPGHTWVQTGPFNVKGRHCNIGPAGTASWWATGEPNKVLLFVVDGIINVCPENISSARAEWLKARGQVHFHEIVHFLGMNNSMPMWELHPKYVVYLEHAAVRFVCFDGGPMAPESDHWVTPGIDYDLIPNWQNIRQTNQVSNVSISRVQLLIPLTQSRSS